MGRPTLRVAGANDAPRPPSERIADALDGSGRDVLASMRLALAKKLDDGEVSSNAIASAYKELRELDRQIRAMDEAERQEADRRADVNASRRSFTTSTL